MSRSFLLNFSMKFTTACRCSYGPGHDVDRIVSTSTGREAGPRTDMRRASFRQSGSGRASGCRLLKKTCPAAHRFDFVLDHVGISTREDKKCTGEKVIRICGLG